MCEIQNPAEFLNQIYFKRLFSFYEVNVTLGREMYFTTECSHSCLKPSSSWLSNTGADPAGIWRRGGRSESGPSSHGAVQPFGGSMEPPSADVRAAGERRHRRALPGCSLTR